MEKKQTKTMNNIEYDDIIEYISIAYAVFNWLSKVYDNYKVIRSKNDSDPQIQLRKKTKVGKILAGIGEVFENLFFAVKSLPGRIFNKK